MSVASAEGDEPAEMKALRQRLKLDARTKPGTLAAAAALARDASLDPVKVFEMNSVPTGSQGLAKVLAARVLRDHLLEREALEPALERWLPADALLLTDDWIKSAAPGLLGISTNPVVLSDDALHATRMVRAQVKGCDEVKVSLITYDLVLSEGESQKKWNDKHRWREQECIRRLEGEAAVIHRAQKSRRRQELRAKEAKSQAQESAVRKVLNGVIYRLEQQILGDFYSRKCAAFCCCHS